MQNNLLNFLPGECDCKDIGPLLNSHKEKINKYLGTDVSAIIENFIDETSNNINLHDKDIFTTIQFSREGVISSSSNQNACLINPRNLVERIDLALKFLKRGYQIQKKSDINNNIQNLLAVNFLSLLWEDNTLYPVIRYKKDIDTITEKQIAEIIDIIKKGRSYYKDITIKR